MRKAGKAGVKADIPESNLIGQRKLLMGLVVAGILLLGLLLMLLFKQCTEGVFKAWCYSVAGTGGLYGTANVVSKIIDKKE